MTFPSARPNPARALCALPHTVVGEMPAERRRKRGGREEKEEVRGGTSLEKKNLNLKKNLKNVVLIFWTGLCAKYMFFFQKDFVRLSFILEILYSVFYEQWSMQIVDD